MTLLFLCNVWRIAVATAYVTMVVAAPEAAKDLQLPAGLLALAVACYDEWARRRR